MKRIPLLVGLLLMLTFSGCEQLLAILESAPVSTTPTQTEIIQGLKQALSEGAARAVADLSAPGGFAGDPSVFIPFPEEAMFAANTLRDLGLGNLVDNFVARLNEGAEKGAEFALPIFRDAIVSMTIADARNILLGDNTHAATEYFESRTRQQLYAAFSPQIQKVLDEVNATEVWEQLTTRYNRIPLVNRKVETDIVRYATDRALDGLFLKLSQEEEKIRQDPVARTTDLLKRVFGYAATQRQG